MSFPFRTANSRFSYTNQIRTHTAVDNTGISDILISGTGKDSAVLIRAHSYGTTSFTIKDGDKEYRNEISIYEDDSGSSRMVITSK